MKKLTKKIVSIFAGVAFAASLTFGIAALTGKTSASADVAPTIDETLRVQMREGASVRIGDDSTTGDRAIRFQSYVKKSYYDTLVNPEMGAYVIPQDLLNGELTNETPRAKNIRTQVFVDETDTHYVFNTVLYNIPENSYGRAIVARAYIKNGSNYVWAENPQVRSLSYVASAALDSGVDGNGNAYDSTAISFLNDYVDKAIKGFSVTEETYTTTVGDSMTVSTAITPVYAEDDLSDLVVQYTSNNENAVIVENGEIFAKGAGVAMVTAKIGTRTDTFSVSVASENQDILMTDTKWSLDMSLPTGYAVTDITCNGESWGSDLTNLAISDTLVSDTTQHGETTVTVAFTDADSQAHTMTLPVTLVTKAISTVSDLSTIRITDKNNQTINGYYILAQDITSASAINSSNVRGEALNIDNAGFRGTFDGRGYSISAPAGAGGIFGTLGVNSVVKNTTFTCTKIDMKAWQTFLAGVGIGSTIENCVFNFSGITETGSSVYTGLIFEYGARSCKFINVDFNITGNVNNLFGNRDSTNKYVGFNGNQANYYGTRCEFTDCTINLMTADSSLTMLGQAWIADEAWNNNTGTVKQFIVDGCTTAAGDTTETVAGITMQSIKYINIELDAQELYLTDATHSLDLGVYADYKVQSITLDGTTDLGKDPSALAIPSTVVNDKTKHGEKEITVVVTSSSEVITLTIPVTLITDTISTAADFAKVQIKTNGGTVYGYYVLTADIGKTTAITSVSNDYYTAVPKGTAGFMGTLDGRGYTITYSIPTSTSGCLFGAIGAGAYIKDVTFDVPSAAPGHHEALFGGSVVGAKFENVEFNFQNVKNYTSAGLIAGWSLANCTFKDVDIYLNSTHGKKVVGNLFAHDGNVNNNDGFNAAIVDPCTFTNCNIYLAQGVQLARVGSTTNADGVLTVYVVDGCSAEGVATQGTTVSGITLNGIENRAVTLEYMQDLYLTAKLQRLDLGEYADYSVSSIKLGNYDFGTNPEKLTVSDAFKADKASHGEQNLTIVAQKGADLVTLTVPVIFVTDTISTMDQLLALQPTASHQKIYGYYVLTSNIGSLDTVVNGHSVYPTETTCTSCANGCGFMGAIDGRGYTISLSIPSENNTYGLFCRIDNGAIFRNLTFDCGSVGCYWGTALLGRVVKDAKFENVTFNFRSVTVNNGNVGLIAEKCTYNCQFTNVDFIINNATDAVVFGGLDDGFRGCTFTDCNVYLLNGSKLNALGCYKVDGVTQLVHTHDGITIEDVEEREITLSYTQDIVLSAATSSLNLGAYADYDITSIKYGDYDLGTDINELAISDELRLDFSNHGEGKTIVVKASKYADIVSINVPVTLITHEISTVSDFAAVQLSQDNVKEEIYGYFVLANDITSNKAIVASGQDSNDAARDGTWGFRGTLDGRGYTVTTPAGGRGMFGAMGTGAVVKDITFTITSINQTVWATSVLGRSVVGVTFEDVVFNVNNITTDNVKGLIGERTVRDCDFVNVEFNLTGEVKQLFPSGISNWIGFNSNQQNFPNTLCTFTGCTINLLTADSSLGMLGAGYNGSTTVTYQPMGVDIVDGTQAVAGVTLRDNTTGTYLLRNNASPYTIVVPTAISTEVLYAKTELIKFFKEATGVELQTVTDNNMTHTDSGLYISLGDTNLAKTAGLSVPTLKRDGGFVKTQDKTIYILGGSDAGVLNGVYELLGELFGYEQYYKDCYTLNTEHKQIELDNYNITDDPDIDYRGWGGIFYTSNMETVTEDDTMYSYRLGSTDAYWKHSMPVVHAADSTKSASDHNSLYYFPLSMYQTSNPEFYSTESTFTENSWGGIDAQLCYTARGNSAGTYDLMTTLAAERIQASLIKYVGNTQYTAVQIGIEDCYQMCTCDGCTAVVNQYGAISATIIIFLNDVAVKVNAWMESNPQYARDLQYMFFAYHEVLRAPTTFPTISEGVKIAPFVAISNMDHDKAIDDTTTRDTTALGTISNNTVYGWMKSWGEFGLANGGKPWAWSYGSFMHDYFVFFDSYEFYKSYFAALTAVGYEMAIIQQHSAQRGTDTAFFAMNAYLNTKLAWDSSLDIDTLISNYMAAMYEDAADEMMSLYTKWQSIYANKLSSVVASNSNPASNLSKSDVDALFDILDTAYEAIAHYETSDPTKYAKLKAHIDMEWLAPAKLAVTGSFAWRYKLTGEYDDIATKFETLCNQFGIVALGEQETIDATIEGL